MSEKNRVYIFDTTMRDGEQSPGASMSLEEKIQIARVFDELGVDIIEAGFPIASPGDFEAVTEVSKILKNSIPAGLSRHSKKDIDICHEALKHAPRFRIHTFISTSPLHMKHKLNKSPEEVYESIKEHVTYARKFTDDVEWSCEDGTRTDMDYMCKTVELAIKCGAKTVNIPDTVGYTVPSEFTKIIQTLFNKVPNIDKAILSTHCHNDLGLAVANSLAGVQAGARQIECTINGIGERAGNAALESSPATPEQMEVGDQIFGLKIEISKLQKNVDLLHRMQNNKENVALDEISALLDDLDIDHSELNGYVADDPAQKRLINNYYLPKIRDSLAKQRRAFSEQLKDLRQFPSEMEVLDPEDYSTQQEVEDRFGFMEMEGKHPKFDINTQKAMSLLKSEGWLEKHQNTSGLPAWYINLARSSDLPLKYRFIKTGSRDNVLLFADEHLYDSGQDIDAAMIGIPVEIAAKVIPKNQIEQWIK